MANAKFIKKWCLKKVKDIEKLIAVDLPKDIEKTARLHFNRAVKEVPADNPYVVVSSNTNGKSATIYCLGEQVLFIEFGAGIKYSTHTSTVLTDSENHQVEYASRPAGIVGIGEYGQGRGKDDSWKYLSRTGRESLHSHIYSQKASGETLMITSGIRPVRALYLAVNSGVKKITTKKLRRIE